MRGSLRIKSIKGCTGHYVVSNALSLVGTYGGSSIKDVRATDGSIPVTLKHY